jgi:thiol-disulfide isomerase/thioredoxin
MIKLETDSLEFIIKSQPKVMVMFGTDWCGNCDILKPEFDKVSKKYNEIPFILVNPDNLPKSRDLVDLTNIPMLVAFRDGKAIFSRYGNKSEIVVEVLNSLF